MPSLGICAGFQGFVPDKDLLFACVNSESSITIFSLAKVVYNLVSFVINLFERTDGSL